jgi:hypothetical protein
MSGHCMDGHSLMLPRCTQPELGEQLVFQPRLALAPQSPPVISQMNQTRLAELIPKDFSLLRTWAYPKMKKALPITAARSGLHPKLGQHRARGFSASVVNVGL